MGDTAGTMNIIDQFVGYGKESIGNIVGSITALQQSNEADKLFRQAKKLRPSDVDPNQVLQLQEIKRKQKAIESGADPLTSLATKQIQTNLATTQGGLLRGSRGDARLLVEGLGRTNVAAGDEVAKLLAANAGRTQFYEGLGYDVSKAISARTFDLEMLDWREKSAQATAMRQSANLNASNLVTNLIAG